MSPSKVLFCDFDASRDIDTEREVFVECSIRKLVIKFCEASETHRAHAV